MQDLLTRGIDEYGNIRSEQTHRFVVKNGMEVPEEWEVVEFESLLNSPLRDFGSFSMTNLIEFLEDGIPFIKSEIVFDNEIRFKHLSFISPKVHSLLYKSWVYPDNILLTKIGAIGRVARYDGSFGVVNSNAATVKIELDQTKARTIFYTIYLQSEAVKRYFELNVISTPPRINLTEIKEMLVPRPPTDEQSRIEVKIESINKMIRIENVKLEKLQSLKTGLMQDLLSGRVRVKVKEEAAAC
jgi:type I restriction enzyme S subunit